MEQAFQILMAVIADSKNIQNKIIMIKGESSWYKQLS